MTPPYIRETAPQIAYRIRNGIPPRPVFISERVEAKAA